MSDRPSEGRYQCPRCKQNLAKRSSLNRHVQDACWKLCNECCDAGKGVHCNASTKPKNEKCGYCKNNGSPCTMPTPPAQSAPAIQSPRPSPSTPTTPTSNRSVRARRPSTTTTPTSNRSGRAPRPSTTTTSAPNQSVPAPAPMGPAPPQLYNQLAYRYDQGYLPQGASSGFQGASSGFQGASSGFQGTSYGPQGTGHFSQFTGHGHQGTSYAPQGTSYGEPLSTADTPYPPYPFNSNTSSYIQPNTQQPTSNVPQYGQPISGQGWGNPFGGLPGGPSTGMGPGQFPDVPIDPRLYGNVQGQPEFGQPLPNTPYGTAAAPHGGQPYAYMGQGTTPPTYDHRTGLPANAPQTDMQRFMTDPRFGYGDSDQQGEDANVPEESEEDQAFQAWINYPPNSPRGQGRQGRG